MTRYRYRLCRNSYDAKTGVYYIALYQFHGKFRRAVQSGIQNSRNRAQRSSLSTYAAIREVILIRLHISPASFLGGAVVTEDYKANAKTSYIVVPGQEVCRRVRKIAVLIDQGSASASEILAGALRITIRRRLSAHARSVGFCAGTWWMSMVAHLRLRSRMALKVVLLTMADSLRI